MTRFMSVRKYESTGKQPVSLAKLAKTGDTEKKASLAPFCLFNLYKKPKPNKKFKRQLAISEDIWLLSSVGLRDGLTR